MQSFEVLILEAEFPENRGRIWFSRDCAFLATRRNFVHFKLSVAGLHVVPVAWIRFFVCELAILSHHTPHATGETKRNRLATSEVGCIPV